MISVIVPEEQRARIWKYLGRHSLANRGRFDGSRKDQYIGLLGEYVVRQYLGIDVEEYRSKEGFDDGVDIVANNGMTIDVKTISSRSAVRPHFQVNIAATQKSYNVHMYVFCHHNTKNNETTICGWRSKKMYFEDATYMAKGEQKVLDNGAVLTYRAASYDLRISQLHDIEELNRIINQDL